jgi:hypothetical protein
MRRWYSTCQSICLNIWWNSYNPRFQHLGISKFPLHSNQNWSHFQGMNKIVHDLSCSSDPTNYNSKLSRIFWLYKLISIVKKIWALKKIVKFKDLKFWNWLLDPMSKILKLFKVRILDFMIHSLDKLKPKTKNQIFLLITFRLCYIL